MTSLDVLKDRLCSGRYEMQTTVSDAGYLIHEFDPWPFSCNHSWCRQRGPCGRVKKMLPELRWTWPKVQHAGHKISGETWLACLLPLVWLHEPLGLQFLHITIDTTKGGKVRPTKHGEKGRNRSSIRRIPLPHLRPGQVTYHLRLWS